MGRRALRKLPDNLDLSLYLLTPEQAPNPWDSRALFARADVDRPDVADPNVDRPDVARPLEIEVGSGKGLFLTAAAANDPEADYLGIEIASKYASHAAARLARRGLTNAKMISGDAERLFRDQLPAGAARAVHVYFPDPWWKARHRKRRVMNPAFIIQIARVLIPGGKLHFWTDVEEYFFSALELLAECKSLSGPIEVAEQPAMHDLDYRTHFERRMRTHGLPVYRSEFRKASE